MANMQSMMDHDYNIMTVCDKVPNFLHFTLDLIFLGEIESIKCGRKKSESLLDVINPPSSL